MSRKTVSSDRTATETTNVKRERVEDHDDPKQEEAELHLISERLAVVRLMRREAVELQRIDRQINEEMQRLVKLTETFLWASSSSSSSMTTVGSNSNSGAEHSASSSLLNGTTGSDCQHRISACEATLLMLAREKLARTRKLRDEVVRITNL